MNKHINKIFRHYKNATGLDKNNTVKLVETDHMPVEVATEMLCAPKAHMTNRQRKECQAARSKVYASVFEPKDSALVLANRLKCCKWDQLNRWEKRAKQRRAELQLAYQLACKRRDKLNATELDPKKEQAKFYMVQMQLAVMNRAIAGLELRAAQIEALWDAVDEEKARRQKMIEALKKVLHPERN